MLHAIWRHAGRRGVDPTNLFVTFVPKTSRPKCSRAPPDALLLIKCPFGMTAVGPIYAGFCCHLLLQRAASQSQSVVHIPQPTPRALLCACGLEARLEVFVAWRQPILPRDRARPPVRLRIIGIGVD